MSLRHHNLSLGKWKWGGYSWWSLLPKLWRIQLPFKHLHFGCLVTWPEQFLIILSQNVPIPLHPISQHFCSPVWLRPKALESFLTSLFLLYTSSNPSANLVCSTSRISLESSHCFPSPLFLLLMSLPSSLIWITTVVFLLITLCLPLCHFQIFYLHRGGWSEPSKN